MAVHRREECDDWSDGAVFGSDEDYRAWCRTWDGVSRAIVILVCVSALFTISAHYFGLARWWAWVFAAEVMLALRLEKAIHRYQMRRLTAYLEQQRREVDALERLADRRSGAFEAYRDLDAS